MSNLMITKLEYNKRVIKMTFSNSNFPKWQCFNGSAQDLEIRT